MGASETSAAFEPKRKNRPDGYFFSRQHMQHSRIDRKTSDHVNVYKNQDETEEHKLQIPKLYFCDSNDLTMSINRLLSEELKKVLYFENFNGFFRIVAKTEKPVAISIAESFSRF